jgi:hypothetical protein
MVFKILPLGYWGYSPGSHPGYGFYIYHLVIGAIARVVPWLWLKKKNHLVIGAYTLGYDYLNFATWL